MTREQVIAAIVACKEKLGRIPSGADAIKYGGLNSRAIYKHFRTWSRALEASGFPSVNGRRAIDPADLFEDWARVARKLQQVPTAREYNSLGIYTHRPLQRLFDRWRHVPAGMKKFAEENHLAEQWKDVMDLVTKPRRNKKSAQVRILKDRPVYGRLIRRCAMLCKPVNEAGVMMLFAAEALRLGFMIVHVQTAYPDCQAWREVGEDRLQLVRIEFERKSRNFLAHKHDPRKCDLIVCWEHNWPECPVEVIELRRLVEIG
ncbi:MAG TPA: hypothetical protein VFR84_01110 [Candidatus Angelobacter sp.]|nr:hypothetical protein [Candidatus Angelobacter sp.]